jgi:hypothetical protein
MLAGSEDYGPFAPAVGYAGAIMAAGTAIFVMWGGKIKKWRPPDKDLPGTARSFVLLLCAVFMVVAYYFAEPSYVRWMILSVALLAIVAVVCYLKYDSLIGTYGYKRPEPTQKDPAFETLILGGKTLSTAAQKKKDELGVSTQDLLAGAQYNVDSLWERVDLQWVKTRALLFFILMLVLGTTTLTTAALAVQVILTKKAAISVIKTEDSPGLETKKPESQPTPASK